MKLFDDIERDYSGPTLYAEPSFTFLNRSARITASRVRDLLETWFSSYPISEQPYLRRRLKSTNNASYQSAFFELFLYELLTRLGCKLLIHPHLSDARGRSLDFEVKCEDTMRFYLEAAIATGKSTQEVGEQARMNAIYDSINQLLDSPNFFIGMILHGTPRTQPSANQLVSFLKQHLDRLDPDQITELAQSNDLRRIPRWHYQHDDWRIEFFPIPKSPEARGKPGIRPLGSQVHPLRRVDSRRFIRDVIIKKANRYGNLSLPYVIAVNATDDFVDNDVILEALFGKAQYIVSLDDSGASSRREIELTRLPDGAWTSKSGPRYRQVSAVLIANRLSPWNVSTASICLYHNPWAHKPYNSVLTCLHQGIVHDDQMHWETGKSLGEIFDLASTWPAA